MHFSPNAPFKLQAVRLVLRLGGAIERTNPATLPVEPNERNGLRTACRLLVDKLTTAPKSKVGARRRNISRSYLYKLSSQNRAPKITKIGRPSFITREDEAA